MKSILSGSILSLFLLSFATPQPAVAQTSGPFAGGTYRFLWEDGETRYVELDARTDERGTTTGQMTFVDPAKIPDVDDDGDPVPRDTPPEFYIRAELDGLTIEKNRAVMSGTILDSSHRTYIGRWVQLVVEDNKDNQEIPDRLTWAFCRPRAGGWIPSDAERKDDDGAYLRWWATDAERKDDVGIPSPDLISNDERSCRIYPFELYELADVLRWEGDLVVQP